MSATTLDVLSGTVGFGVARSALIFAGLLDRELHVRVADICMVSVT
jgi:hypothetical protein